MKDTKPSAWNTHPRQQGTSPGADSKPPETATGPCTELHRDKGAVSGHRPPRAWPEPTHFSKDPNRALHGINDPALRATRKKGELGTRRASEHQATKRGAPWDRWTGGPVLRHRRNADRHPQDRDCHGAARRPRTHQVRVNGDNGENDGISLTGHCCMSPPGDRTRQRALHCPDSRGSGKQPQNKALQKPNVTLFLGSTELEGRLVWPEGVPRTPGPGLWLPLMPWDVPLTHATPMKSRIPKPPDGLPSLGLSSSKPENGIDFLL